MTKPAHFCADAGFDRLEPDDPRMKSCQCQFVRDQREPHRGVHWGPVRSTAGAYGIRLGGALLWLDDHGGVAEVLAQPPVFESTLIRDAVTQMGFIVSDYVERFNVDRFRHIHFATFVCDTLNIRLDDRLRRLRA